MSEDESDVSAGDAYRMGLQQGLVMAETGEITPCEGCTCALSDADAHIETEHVESTLEIGTKRANDLLNETGYDPDEYKLLRAELCATGLYVTFARR